MNAKPVGCDSSVLIPALTPWHPEHETCLDRLQSVEAIPVHVLAESYSVMTRAAGGFRVTPEFAAEVLTGQPWRVLELSGAGYERVIRLMAQAGKGGGAIHDAIIAATLDEHSYALLSRDRRAAATYDLVGVDYELI